MRQPGKPYYPPHIYQDNQVYFITAVVIDGRPFLAADEAKCLVKDELRASILDYGIELKAWVILHNHYLLFFWIKAKEQLAAFLKRLHGATAIGLNKLHGTPGRRVWRNYWDYCPRDERDMYRAFNYIHINPIKHGLLTLPGLRVDAEKGVYAISAAEVPDLHTLLVGYEFSSYPFYARKFYLEGITNVWLDYPVPSAWEGDNL